MESVLVTFWLLVHCGLYWTVLTQPYCQCGINRDNVVQDYDGSHFRLQLPCEYYFTDVTTRDGCHVSVTLDSEGLFRFDNNFEMRGIHFSVDKGKDTIFGTLNNDGVQKRNSTIGDNFGMHLPSIIREGQLRLTCYEDSDGFINLYVPTCSTILRYHINGLVEVLTPRPALQSHHRYVCGHCSTSQNPLSSLPGGVGKDLKLREDVLAAWLYHSSLRVRGGSRQCYQFRSEISHCSPSKAMKAMRLCGSLLTGSTRMARCIIGRAVRPQIYTGFFKCVSVFCGHKPSDTEKHGCAVVKNLAHHFGCTVDRRMKC